MTAERLRKTQPRINDVPSYSSMKPQRTWELKLGPLQAMILIGFVLGSLVASYMLGAHSGQNVGFSMASDLATVGSPRQEIPAQEIGDSPSHQEVVPDIYAKLSQIGARQESHKKEDRPKLGVIEKSEDAPLVPTSVKTVESVEAKASEVGISIRELGAVAPEPKKPNVGEGKTLGALVAEEKREKIPLTVTEVTQPKAGDLDNEVVKALQESRKTGEAHALVAADELNKVKKSVTVPSLTAPSAVSPSAVPLSVSTTAQVQATKTVAAVTSTPLATPTAKKGEKGSAPSTKSEFIREALPKGWFAQVSAPKELDEAESLGKSLKASGFSVVIEKAEVRGEKYYRLLVGPEEMRSQAERLVSQLKREKGIKGEPFLRLVK